MDTVSVPNGPVQFSPGVWTELDRNNRSGPKRWTERTQSGPEGGLDWTELIGPVRGENSTGPTVQFILQLVTCPNQLKFIAPLYT